MTRFLNRKRAIEVTSARKVVNKDKLADVISKEIDIVRQVVACFEPKKTRSSDKLFSIDNPWRSGLLNDSDKEYVDTPYSISVQQYYSSFNINRDINSYPGINKLTGASKEIANNLQGFISSNVEKGLLYQGKYVTCIYHTFTLITVVISFSEKHPYVIQQKKQFSGITDAALVKMINNNLLSYANTSNFMTFPSLYNENFEVKPLRQSKLLMGQDGFVIEIPRITKTNYESFVDATIKGSAIHNAIISVDDKVKAVVYLDENTQQQIFSYNGATVILNRNKTNWLNKPVSSLYTSLGTQNLAAIYDWPNFFKDVKAKYGDYLEFPAASSGLLDSKVAEELDLPDDDDLRKPTGQITVGDLIVSDPHKFLEFIEDLKKAANTKFALGGMNNAWKVPVYLRFTGLLTFLKRIAEEGPVAVKSATVKEKMAFNNAKASDMPPVPNMNPEVALFPHQAEALAKLEISQQSAIVDCSTGSGKCVKYNQLVHTLTGIYTLRELFESGNQHKARKDATEWFSDLNNVEIYSTEGEASSNWAYRRVAGEPTVGWKFTDGSYIEGLKDHKLKVFNPKTCKLDWKRLDEIKPGDWLPKRYKLNYFGNNVDLGNNEDVIEYVSSGQAEEARENLPEKLTVPLAKLMGYMVAEGSLNTAVSFTNSNELVINDFVCCFEQVFNVSPTVIHDTNNNTTRVEFTSYIDKFFQKHLGKKWSNYRYVPLCIRTAPKRYQVAFLSALFEGDGTVYLKDHNRWRIDYCSISRELAFQVKYMLENMGIVSTVRWHDTSTNPHNSDVKTIYELTIQPKHIPLFEQEVGFISTDKKEKLAEASCRIRNDISKEQDYDDTNIINRTPYVGLYNELVSIVDTIGSCFSYNIIKDNSNTSRQIDYSWRNLFHKTIGKYPKTVLSEEHVLVSGFIRHVNHVLDSIPTEIEEQLEKNERFNFIRLQFQCFDEENHNRYFVQAEEQFTGNEEFVYDISVPGPHSYLLDGFMSHNTISIITDILNLMNQKKVKRPLVLMPSALIGQWISQINFFTKGSINAFAITTDVINSRATKDKSGYEVLAETIANLPPNTIFLTSLDFIKTGKELVFSAPSPKDNIYSYAGVDWIKEAINPDLIAIDEAHKIKNQKTDVCKATYALGDGVEFKRIATGTLINNNPDDLIGQVGFLDPNIIGNESEFKSRYYERSTRGGRTKYTRPVANFAELVRNDLRNNTNYIIYRKKDWASLLPKIVYTQEFVDMNKAQQDVYNDMVHKTLEDIFNNPVLIDIIRNLTSEDGDFESDMELPAWILGKLAVLEQYLTAPELHNLVEKLGEDAISPKLPKIDELIGESIKQGYKVIVAVHYKEAAKHLMKYSKYSRNSLYYDASKKDLISEFKNNKNIHVLFAVSISLKEGLNLQCANRIIVADVDWTPGGLEQLEARIFRPSLEIRDGKIINKNEGKTVYISTVICNHSADIVKYVFQNFKRIRNSIIMENCPVPGIKKPGFDEQALTAAWGDPVLGGMDTVRGIEDFRTWQTGEIDKERSRHLEFVPIKAAPKLPGKSIPTPWVPGMDLPLEDGEMPLTEYLEQFPDYMATKDLHTVEDKLTGQVVKTEFGYGTVKEVNKRSKTKLYIRLFDGKILSAYPGVLTVILPDADENKIRELEKKAGGVGGGGRRRQQPIGNETSRTGGGSSGDDNSSSEESTTPSRKPRDTTRKPRDTDSGSNTSTDDSATAELPTGEVTRKKLNELAEPYGLVLKKKTKDDGVHWYWKPLERDDIALRIQNVEELSDKSWKRWLKNIKSSAKAFEEYYAEESDNSNGDDSRQSSSSSRGSQQQTERDYKIELHMGTYNSIPMLIAYPSDPDSADLQNIGFKLFPETWTLHIPNKNFGLAVLKKLQTKFNVPTKNAKEIEDVLNNMTRSKYGHDFPEDAKNFMTLIRKRAKEGNLKVYPLIIDERVYFVVDKSSHPGVKLTRYKFNQDKFEEESSFYGYLAKSIADIKKKLKQVTKMLEITNIKTLTKEAKDLFGISLSN